MFEDFQTDDKFDLATFRMAAEPIANPEAILKKLARLFVTYGFEEVMFRYLEDLSVFSRFKILNLFELSIWRICDPFHIKRLRPE